MVDFETEELRNYPTDEEMASIGWLEGSAGKQMIRRSGCRSEKTYFTAICALVKDCIGIGDAPYIKDGVYVITDSICIDRKDVNVSVRIGERAAIVSIIMSFKERIPQNRELLIAYVCNDTNAGLFGTLVYDGTWPDLFYLEAVMSYRTIFAEEEFRQIFELLKNDTKKSVSAVRELNRPWLPQKYRQISRKMHHAG